jgi:hypothetical protein
VEADGAGGIWQRFEFGHIDKGNLPFAVWGSIDHAWASYGGPAVTGQAANNETARFNGAISEFVVESGPFRGAALFLAWNPGLEGSPCAANSDNVCEIYGAIGSMWDIAAGALHLPVNNAYDADGRHVRQDFVFGYITWNSLNGNTCAYEYSSHGDVLIDLTGFPC